jgi:DNA-directed RNA polymerase beta' subunit
MNFYVSTSIATRNEITEMSSIHNWLISHAYSSPAYIGQVDDSIIGSFELTRSNVRFDKYHAMLLFANTSKLPIFEKDTYTGRDIITKVLEKTPVTFRRNTTWYNENFAGIINYDPTETKVFIDNGVHKEGVLDSSSIGSTRGGLFHHIANEYGSRESLRVMFDIQQVAIGNIFQKGFSIGIMDIIIDENTRKRIFDIESTIINESELITDRLNRGEIIPPIGKTTEQFYEELQISKLKVLDDFSVPILQNTNTNSNNLFKLVSSGSKGKMQHVYHIKSAIGQILINGERVRQNYSYKRTLPYFKRFDTNPESRGYITNSYFTGMSPAQNFFNAGNARFDFITKALSTSITGEQNRKSIKNLESIVINNMRMCTKADNIIQLLYGEDGADPRSLMDVKFYTVKISDKQLENDYYYKSSIKSLQNIFDKEFKYIKFDRNEYRRRFLNLERSNVSDLFTDERPMAVNVGRLIEIIMDEHKNEFKPIGNNAKALAKMVLDVEEFCSKLPYVYLNDIQEQNKFRLPEYLISATWLLKMSVRMHLCATKLTKFNETLLINIMRLIRIKLALSFVDYGTAVGIIAAQSFSAPLTQYMLDAQHRSVTGGTSKSGMDRAKEILGARKTERLSAPSMLITVTPDIQHNRAEVQELANKIEVMKLKQFVSIWQIFFEKYGNPIHPQYKHESAMIKEFEKYNPLLKQPNDLVNWCIRFTMDKSNMILKNMSLETIITKLRDVYNQSFIVYTPENSKHIIIRIYFRSGMFKTLIDERLLEGIVRNMLEVNIRGVENIRMTEVVKVIRHVISDEGSVIRSSEKNEIYGIKTLGTNFTGVMNMKKIDRNTLITDSIDETQRMLGISAARKRIISELRQLGDGRGINYRHFAIYADEMTYTGKVTSIERAGLNKREINNVLLRLGFVSPVPTLEEAAVNTMEDTVTGVTAKLLIGTTPDIGTAYNQFYINEDFIKKNVVKADKWLDSL